MFRQRLELAIVRLVLDRAKAEGFEVYAVFDGDEETHTPTVDECLALVFNLDDSVIQFRKGAKDDGYWVRVVLGNGEDCLGDYGTSPDFDKVMDSVSELIEHGAIRFEPCVDEKPAWDHSPTNRGLCINCGSDHRK